MREKRQFNKRTAVLESDAVRKKYFLVYEGTDTEAIYFSELGRLQESFGISPLIELVPLLRSYSERGWTNPQKLLQCVLDNIDESQSGCISYKTLLDSIVGYLEDCGVIAVSGVQSGIVWSLLVECCEEKLSGSLYLDVQNPEEDCVALLDYLNDRMSFQNLVKDIGPILEQTGITYDAAIDRICLIVDRDSHSFFAKPDNPQYRSVYDDCKKYGVGFYVSNPCFEFWLLLHFDKVLSLDRELLAENEKVHGEKRYAEAELCKLLPGYKKSHYNVSSIIVNLERALKNEKAFCETIEELVCNVGSNVGLLIQEMRLIGYKK